MAEWDEAQRRADLDWLYHRQPGETAPADSNPARVTNINDESDLERREREYLAQRRAAAKAAAGVSAHRQPSRSQTGSTGRRPPGRTPAMRPDRIQPTNQGPTRRQTGIADQAAARNHSGGRGQPPATALGHRRPRHRGRRALSAIVVLVLLAVGWLVWVPMTAWANVKQVDNVPAGTRPPQQPGTAILLIGTDTRQDLTPEQQAQLGTGNDAGTRTDTMMILYVPPKGRSVLISLPRDTWLTIPDQGQNKLNAAYALGGPKLMTQTVEQATGLRMDGYLEIGFAGFANIVDAVGGVQICLDKPMVDANSNINLPAGCQTLNGPNALGYVRQRYQDPQGDLGRVQRQRQVVGLIAKKAATPATLLNPKRYWDLSRAFSAALVRGTDTGLGDMFAAGRGMLAISQGNGLTLTVPVGDPNAVSPDGQSIVVWDHQRASEMFDEIARGDTSQLDQFVG